MTLPLDLAWTTLAGGAPLVTVIVPGYSPHSGRTPPGKQRPCGSVTLLRLDGRVVLVDVGREDDLLLSGLAAASLSPDDVELVILTHSHRDHFSCLPHLPRARVLMGGVELDDARVRFGSSDRPEDRELLERARPIEDEVGALPVSLRVEPAPGHTAGSLAIVADLPGCAIAICGDTGGSRDAFARWEPSRNSASPELELSSMRRLSALASMVVPGHGLPFRMSDGQAAEEIAERHDHRSLAYNVTGEEVMTWDQ